MKSVRRVQVQLATSSEQAQKLLSLQSAFALLCNEITPVVQSTRTWNRVALHHLVYKTLREKYPAVGSQMVCNAIYSVSRTSRLLFQSPQSPFHLSKLSARGLPLMKFTNQCPVYFDRHTLSLKNGTLSMYTLDGRMKFQVALSTEDEATFHQQKLREVVLSRKGELRFELAFLFGDEKADLVSHEAPATQSAAKSANESWPAHDLISEPPGMLPATTSLPEYVSVEQP